MDSAPIKEKALWSIYLSAIEARRAELLTFVMEKTKGIVQHGPFAGMTVLADASWGDVAAKLLGFYEEELHGALENAIALAPDLIVNVGCAEGYYAVGLKRRLPAVHCVAFDSDAAAREICGKAAIANQLATGFDVRGIASPADLQSLLVSAKRPLLFMDCEGGELELLDPERVPALAHARVLVELHDFINRTIMPTLLSRLRTTHRLQLIAEGGRNPNRSPILAGLNSIDRWLAVNEFRPEQMNWLYAVPNGSP